MNSRRFSSSRLPLHLFSIFVLVAGIPLSWSSHDLYENCRDAEFRCGDFTAGYPFSGGARNQGCGRPGLRLDCENDIPKIEIIGIRYQVLHIDPDRQILRIARVDLINNGFCSKQTQNSTLDSHLFELVSIAPDYTEVALAYNCPPWIPSVYGRFTCNATAVNGPSYKDVSVHIAYLLPPVCAYSVTVPVLGSHLAGILNNISPSSLLEEALNAGFEVYWKEDREACAKCRHTDGTCGFDAKNETICYCPIPAENWQEARECHPSPQPAGGNVLTNFQGSMSH